MVSAGFVSCASLCFSYHRFFSVDGLGAVLTRTEAALDGDELRQVLDRMAYLDERVS